VLDNFFTLMSNVSGITVDLISGNDTLVVANGINSLSALNVDQINGSDFSTTSNDALTLESTVNGLSVNLGNGTNMLQLAGGTNTLNSLNNINTLNGTGGADSLTITGGVFASGGATIDLGGGTDSLNVSNPSFGMTVVNVETVTLSAQNDSLTIGNAAGATTTVTGGLGVDFISASAGHDNFRFTSVADSGINVGRDVITNFNADDDAFVFSSAMVGPGGLSTSTISFVGNFDSSGGAEARLTTIGGLSVIQIDANGDGLMTSSDMEIQVNNLTGILHGSNFLIG
jgi:Ca2+-binding RTX toxin-like protein